MAAGLKFCIDTATLIKQFLSFPLNVILAFLIWFGKLLSNYLAEWDNSDDELDDKTEDMPETKEEEKETKEKDEAVPPPKENKDEKSSKEESDT